MRSSGIWPPIPIGDGKDTYSWSDCRKKAVDSYIYGNFKRTIFTNLSHMCPYLLFK